MEKSANQLYKESKSSLPFIKWIEREKNKGIFIKNQVLADIIGEEETNKNIGSAKFDFGVPKWVIISGVLIIIGSVIYNKYQK